MINLYNENGLKIAPGGSGGGGGTLSTFRGCSVYRTSNLAIAGTVIITFQASNFDTNGFFSGPSTTMVVPTGYAGYYRFGFTADFALNSGTTATRMAYMIDTSSGYRIYDGTSTTSGSNNATGWYSQEGLAYMAEGDTFQMTGIVDTGTRTLTAFTGYGMWCEWLGT